MLSTHHFALPSDNLEYHPSVYHHKEMNKMFELGEQFLKLEANAPQVFGGKRGFGNEKRQIRNRYF